MIGTEANAILAYDGMLDFLSEGSTRTAYLADNIVYKVEAFWSEGVNETEFFNSISLFPPDPFVVVDCHLFPNGVLAMPFIDGTLKGECDCGPRDTQHAPHCMPDDIAAVGRSICLDIPTWGNTVLKDGKYYLIDLGQPLTATLSTV